MSDQPASPKTDAEIIASIKLSDRIEWLRSDTEDRVIDVYRLIDQTPDAEAVNPKLAEAYQQLARAALALTDARRNIVLYEEAVAAERDAERIRDILQTVAEAEAMAHADAYDKARRDGTAVEVGSIDDVPALRSASDEHASAADAIIEAGRSARSADAHDDDATSDGDGYNYVADDLNFDAARERAARR